MYKRQVCWRHLSQERVEKGVKAQEPRLPALALVRRSWRRVMLTMMAQAVASLPLHPDAATTGKKILLLQFKKKKKEIPIILRTFDYFLSKSNKKPRGLLISKLLVTLTYKTNRKISPLTPTRATSFSKDSFIICPEAVAKTTVC